jgi:predicted nucleotidyltransferase
MATQRFTDLFAEKRFTADEQWMVDNLVMECVMGSQAYGTNQADSDFDVVAVVMDKHQALYPQSYGYVLGFDKSVPTFDNVEYKGERNRLLLENGRDVEGVWHSLTNFFHLAGVHGSPNLLEVLFVRRPLVKYGHNVAWMMRDNRKLFLSMKSFSALKGYLNSQVKRVVKEAARWAKEGKCDNSKRRALYERDGYDTKMSYHPLRLGDLLHQMLTQGDLDLMRNKEECKRMRSGDWGTLQDFERIMNERMQMLERLAMESSNPLPQKPNTEALRKLLQECVEEWYGSEDQMVRQGTEYVSAKDVKEMFEQLMGQLSK